MTNLHNSRSQYAIIIPVTESVSWSWSADYLRQTVLCLAKMGWRVIVYMDSDPKYFLNFGRKTPPKIKNVLFYYPKYPLPFKRFEKVRELNRTLDLTTLVKKYGKSKKLIFWLFSPVSGAIMKLISAGKDTISLYDCVDYYGSDDRATDQLMRAKENILIKSVDRFFVNSKALKNLHREIRLAELVPQGFALNIYKKKLATGVSLPKAKPLIGFVGSLDARLDFKLILPLVDKFKNCTFVFWGPIDAAYFDAQPDKKKSLVRLLSFDNVIHGQSSRDKIPGLIRQFDIGIIPYDIDRNFCKYCYPMKLFEYFYLGKPVIATPIEELKSLPRFVTLGKNVVDWAKAIRSVLARPRSPRLTRQQKDMAIQNSWDNKVGKMVYELGVTDKK